MWDSKPGKGGIVIRWNGEPFTVRVRVRHRPGRDCPCARCYLGRVRERYPHGPPGRPVRRRGGTYIARWRDNDRVLEERIQADSKTAARAILLYRLRRQRLPAGLTWELER